MKEQKNNSKTGLITLAVVVIVVCGVAALYVVNKSRNATYAGPPTVKLISQKQYENSISYIFGSGIEVPPQFPPVPRIDGLSALGAAETSVTPSVVERFYGYGKTIAEQVMSASNRDYLVPCKPQDAKAPDELCATKFISTAGELLYRRPLGDEELNRLVNLADTAASTVNDFYLGLTYVLTAMLSSPKFVLIADQVEEDPDAKGSFRLDAYSKASRMSFFLWNSGPDSQLLAAAASGDLHTEAGVREQLERMVASPRLRDSLRGFFADMFDFQDFENLAKDSLIYPSFGPRVSGEAAEQMLRMITQHLIDEKGDYRELYTTRKTFMTNALGAVYRVPVDPALDYVPYEFPPDSNRGGLLTHVGFLSVHSHPGRSSPTLRGVGLREQVLCQPVPPPPPNVDFSNFEDAAGDFKTARDRLVRHSSDAACAGCHKITDPTGLGLEQFDGAGQFRKTENGVAIDASGELDGLDFSDAVSLGEAVRDNPATTSCVITRMLAYGINRPVKFEDQAVIDNLNDDFSDKQYQIPELMKSIVLSKAFFAVDFRDDNSETDNTVSSID